MLKSECLDMGNLTKWPSLLRCYNLYPEVLRTKDRLLDNCRVSSTTSFQARYCLSTFHFSFNLILLVPAFIPLCHLLLFPFALWWWCNQLYYLPFKYFSIRYLWMLWFPHDGFTWGFYVNASEMWAALLFLVTM